MLDFVGRTLIPLDLYIHKINNNDNSDINKSNSINNSNDKSEPSIEFLRF